MDPLTATAIERWDAALEANGASADRLDELRRSLLDRGLEADGRPLCMVLRPHLIAARDLRRQSEIASLVVSATRKARDAMLGHERHARHLEAFREWIGVLLELEARPIGEGALLRLDASLSPDGLHFIELNADMPQGVGHHDAILDFFQSLEPYRKLADEVRIEPLPLEDAMSETLLSVWREWGGKGEPSIAIVTHTDDPVLFSSLEVDLERYRLRGLEAMLCEPHELTFEGGRLRHDDLEIDIVHRVVGTAECLADPEGVRGLLDAVRAGAVCMVNPFRSELLGHKAIFALLTNPDENLGLTAAERGAIDAHVPWTRVVAEGRTRGPDGEEVELPGFLLASRERLVLKPTHDFGGHGVRLGWRESESEWHDSVAQALGSDYVAQLRVPLHREEYPTMEADGSRRDYFEDSDPFLFLGRQRGLLTRLSPGELTNVHAEGSVVASFAVGEG